MRARIEGRYCFSSVCEYWMYWTSGGKAASLDCGSAEEELEMEGEDIIVVVAIVGGSEMLEQKKWFPVRSVCLSHACVGIYL